MNWSSSELRMPKRFTIATDATGLSETVGSGRKICFQKQNSQRDSDLQHTHAAPSQLPSSFPGANFPLLQVQFLIVGTGCPSGLTMLLYRAWTRRNKYLSLQISTPWFPRSIVSVLFLDRMLGQCLCLLCRVSTHTEGDCPSLQQYTVYLYKKMQSAIRGCIKHELVECQCKPIQTRICTSQNIVLLLSTPAEPTGTGSSYIQNPENKLDLFHSIYSNIQF